MSNNNTNKNNTNNNNNKKKIKTGNIAVDIGLSILVAAGGAVAGEVSHRVKEVRTRRKARDLEVKTNNEEGRDE